MSSINFRSYNNNPAVVNQDERDERGSSRLSIAPAVVNIGSATAGRLFNAVESIVEVKKVNNDVTEKRVKSVLMMALAVTLIVLGIFAAAACSATGIGAVVGAIGFALILNAAHDLYKASKKKSVEPQSNIQLADAAKIAISRAVTLPNSGNGSNDNVDSTYNSSINF